MIVDKKKTRLAFNASEIKYKTHFVDSIIRMLKSRWLILSYFSIHYLGIVSAIRFFHS